MFHMTQANSVMLEVCNLLWSEPVAGRSMKEAEDGTLLTFRLQFRIMLNTVLVLGKFPIEEVLLQTSNLFLHMYEIPNGVESRVSMLL